MTEDEKEARRSRANLIVLAVVVVIVILGILLMRWLAYEQKLSDCVAAAHRDCAPVEQPQDQ
jgi:flagellar basal body-associated protein FliL